jgi:lipopolysaccharide biosynthesis protein
MSLSVPEIKTNEDFYDNCNSYFNALRKSGKTDFAFEDEYFFTLPAISGQ